MKPIKLQKDMFEEAAEQYFKDTDLPYDKIRIFTLANQFAHYTLTGANQQIDVVTAGIKRVHNLQESAKEEDAPMPFKSSLIQPSTPIQSGIIHPSNFGKVDKE
jgi:hypothetical protein